MGHWYTDLWLGRWMGENNRRCNRYIVGWVDGGVSIYMDWWLSMQMCAWVTRLIDVWLSR